MPTGGVTRPIPMTTVTRTPSTIGSMPTDIAIGKMIGMNSVRVAIDSMNIVTMKNSRRIMIRMTVGLVEKPSILSVSHLSKPAVVSRIVNSFADPITVKIRAETRTVSPSANLMSAHFSSRYTRPPTMSP